MNTKIKDYEIVDLGIEYFDYFQGFGTAFTNFEDEVVGTGYSSKDAYEEALDAMASRNIDVSDMPEFGDSGLWYHTIDDEDETASEDDEDFDDPLVFVGIRYNLK